MKHHRYRIALEAAGIVDADNVSEDHLGEYKDRNREIIRMLLSGSSLSEVAQEHNLSRERVRSLAHIVSRKHKA